MYKPPNRMPSLKGCNLFENVRKLLNRKLNKQDEFEIRLTILDDE